MIILERSVRPFTLDSVGKAIAKINKKSKGGIAEARAEDIIPEIAKAFFKSEEAARSLQLLKGAFEEAAALLIDSKHDLSMDALAVVKKITKGKLDPDLALLFVLAQAAPGSWS